MTITAKLGQPLSGREQEILLRIAEGKSNVEIGRELHLTDATVKTHCGRLFRKLGARDRAHAVMLGVVAPGEAVNGPTVRKSCPLLLQAALLLTRAGGIEQEAGDDRFAETLHRHAASLRAAAFNGAGAAA